MRVSYQWLQSYFEKKLPPPAELAELLTMHTYEVEKVESVGNDTALEIDVLPNRSHDSLCHRGVARDIAILLNYRLKGDPLSTTSSSIKHSVDIGVQVDDSTACKRYTTAVVSGLSVQPSPQWLQEFLVTIGQKPINNIVDTANYVMFNIGQPIHTFDHKKIQSIGVRFAKKDEKLLALDDETYVLSEEDLVITNDKTDEVVAIAGIKGGKSTEVDGNTTSVLIESANFDSVMVRKTRQRLKMSTDASKRFENEISPELTVFGIYEAIRMLKEVTTGTEDVSVQGFGDIYPLRANGYKANVSTREVNRQLGTEMEDRDVETVLDQIGWPYTREDSVAYVVSHAEEYVGTPYVFGASVSYDAPRAFDCSSFTAFLFAHGGLSIPRVSIDQCKFGTVVSAEDMVAGDLIFTEGSTPHTTDDLPFGVGHVGIYLGDGRVIHAAGEDSGFNAVVVEELAESKKFQKPVAYRRMGNGEKRYVVDVPFERLDIRRSADLVEEIGRVYGYHNIPSLTLSHAEKPPTILKSFYWANRIRDLLAIRGFSEVYTYAFDSEGDAVLLNPLSADKSALRANIARQLARACTDGRTDAPLLGLERDAVRIFEIGTVYTSSGERQSLCIGVTNKKAESVIKDTWEYLSENLPVELSASVHGGVSEVDLSSLFEHEPSDQALNKIEDRDIQYQEYSAYPYTLRDIALWVPTDIDARDVKSFLEDASGELLVRISLFDTFLKDDRTSYAFHLVFQSYEKTLSDEEVNTVMKRVEDSVSEKGWEVR